MEIHIDYIPKFIKKLEAVQALLDRVEKLCSEDVRQVLGYNSKHIERQRAVQLVSQLRIEAPDAFYFRVYTNSGVFLSYLDEYNALLQFWMKLSKVNAPLLAFQEISGDDNGNFLEVAVFP